MSTLLQYFIAGTLGLLLHVFAVKFPSLKKRFVTSNERYTFRMYLSEDWTALVADFIVVLILIVGVREVLNLRPDFERYITWIFIFVGFTGSSIMLAIFSVANKKFLGMIDEKSNIADGKMGDQPIS